MTTTTTIHKLLASAGTAAAFAASSLVAGDYGKAIVDDKMPIEAPWTICNVFDYSTLYEADSGFIREISLNGRYHGQAISQSKDLGGQDIGYNNWQHRRFRLGMDIEFAGNVTLKTSADISNGSGSGTGLTRGPFFNGWDEFYIDWEPKGEVLQYVEIGKQKEAITREYSTSSRQILTVERSQIVNETTDMKPWGVTAGFKFFGMKHEFGGWVHGLDDNEPLGNWMDSDSRGGFSYRGEASLTDETSLHLDYAFTNNSSGLASPQGSAGDSENSAYNHVIAIGSESEWGRFGLITDLIFGINREASGLIPAGDDTWGLVILPYYNITEKLQFVAKYAYMDQGREQRTQRFGEGAGNLQNGRTRAENYHTFYAGLNYYLCDHNLKLMAGYEYATGDEIGTGAGISSDTWMLAIRTYF
jgi:phosphate-selective porin OprO/OprP